MDKMQMAHEMAMELVKIKPSLSAWQIADRCFEYADAMQAEADKRNKSEAAQKRKEMREILNAPNTFVEREGQHFDDLNWQPDWSKAPDGYNYWVATADHNGKISGGWFYDVEPAIGDSNGPSIYYSRNNNCIPTGSFGYTGKWQDSLRERTE